jgi:hypothetical protein
VANEPSPLHNIWAHKNNMPLARRFPLRDYKNNQPYS